MGFWHIAHYLILLAGSRKHFRACGSVHYLAGSPGATEQITGVLRDASYGDHYVEGEEEL